MVYLEPARICVGQVSKGREVLATKFALIRFLIIPRALVIAMVKTAKTVTLFPSF